MGSTVPRENCQSGSSIQKRILISKYLQHVAEDAEDAVESFVVLGSGTSSGMSLPADTGHELSHETKIDNKRAGQQRVFTDV